MTPKIDHATDQDHDASDDYVSTFHWASGVRGSHPTSELTRRREFIQASPHHSLCETHPRRSRPTICSAQSRNPELFFVGDFPPAALFFENKCISISA